MLRFFFNVINGHYDIDISNKRRSRVRTAAARHSGSLNN